MDRVNDILVQIELRIGESYLAYLELVKMAFCPTDRHLQKGVQQIETRIAAHKKRPVDGGLYVVEFNPQLVEHVFSGFQRKLKYVLVHLFFLSLSSLLPKRGNVK